MKGLDSRVWCLLFLGAGGCLCALVSFSQKTHYKRNVLWFECEVSHAHLPDPPLLVVSSKVVEPFVICPVGRYKARAGRVDDYKAQPGSDPISMPSADLLRCEQIP